MGAQLNGGISRLCHVNRRAWVPLVPLNFSSAHSAPTGGIREGPRICKSLRFLLQNSNGVIVHSKRAEIVAALTHA